MATALAATPAELAARLPELTVRDEHRLRRRLDDARRRRDPGGRERALDGVAGAVRAAEERVARRRAAVPAVTYPAELPVSARRDEIAAAIRDHQVVVVAGETGSGKTTQLPKICLELGRGVRGTIGHTQPRRIAARTVAERIAAELDVPLGEAVGYQVRFTEQAGESTLVKLMTDGILLAEIQRDRLLRGYDTLIIDEAHERSLNVDFLLGYLRELLPRRPDLKVVITSATIDPARFAAHFATPERPVPVVEVSGRTYPVEVRYRPLLDDAGEDDEAAEPRDQVTAICDAVRELHAEGPGDVLVFLSGEREIRDTREALEALALRDTEVLPLFARLSAAEQHRVFEPHTQRRVVLATNVAETSLTVPGIRYVVDPGTARISRYSARTKVQRLPIEPISQASANQRAGRCGRTADGICIRLYSEADYESRPEFTDPEILRTSLAAVILQMTSLGLGDVEAFGFLDPPDRRAVRDGIALLQELGALDPATPGLTPLGRDLAQLPIDPRLGRMVLAAGRNGALDEVLVIAAALTVQDPRERPAEHQQAADAAHARFRDESSDFLAWLNLWRYVQERQDELSSSAFRRMCKREYLSWLRVREWQDLHGQLRSITRQLSVPRAENPADAAAVHQALLTGLLSHLGLYDPDKRDYLGARGARFAVWPGSGLARKHPRWVVAGELVETSRLWGRECARIEPEWVEPLASHLVVRTHSEPRWSAKRASAVATERVTLYGVPIVTGRTVAYGRIDPVVSRELFLRHALVQGEWRTPHRFFHDNRALLDEVADLEDRVRRRDVVVDDETLYALYDERIPADVVSGQHFDTWWKRERRRHPDLLTFTREQLVNPRLGEVRPEDFPDELPAGGLTVPLSYAFSPGEARDGVTVDVPLAGLPRLDAAAVEWGVPGRREELVTELLRSLPKPVRRTFVPVPDTARAVLARVRPGEERLVDGVTRVLYDLTRVDVPRDAWDLDALPPHLRPTVRVLDGERVLAEGKDVDELRRRLAPAVEATLAQAASSVERTGLREFPADGVPRRVTIRRDGHALPGYPALVDEGSSVAVRVLPSPARQRVAHAAGTRRLLALTVPSPVRGLRDGLSTEARLTLRLAPSGDVPALLADVVDASIDLLVARSGGPAWDAAGWARLRTAVAARLPATAATVLDAAQRALLAVRDVSAALAALPAPFVRGDGAEAIADVRAHVRSLVHPGFVAEVGAGRVRDLERWLRAVERRLADLPRDPARDADRMAAVRTVQAEYQRALDALPPGEPPPPELAEVRWMLEELRVSYWAQSLGTRHPVSPQRIVKALRAP